MFNINTANNASINPRFRKRAKRVKKLVSFESENGEVKGSHILDLDFTLKDDQDCNNCKAQRMPRFHRQHGHDLKSMTEFLQEHRIGTVMSSRDYQRRGMSEEAYDVLEFDGINLRLIQARRRRERDQAQKWKRSGKLIAVAKHVEHYGMGQDRFNQLTGGPDFN